MSQRGVIFHQLDDVGREWAMNGFIPPLIMELNVDTLAWCASPLPAGYPDKVRTYTMTNDHFLLKSCWLGPYVKMSEWLDKRSMPVVYGPVASRMESAGNMLKNIYSYFHTYDVLYAADFNPNLSTDLTFVQVTKHTAATFKMETPMNLNDPKHQVQSCVFAETDTNEMEFYNPVYDNGMAKFGVPGRTPETVTVNSRLLSNNFCADDDNSATLKDTLSRIPGDMNDRIYRAYVKMQNDYAKMRNLYSKNGIVPPNLPGVIQLQQAAQATNAGGEVCTNAAGGSTISRPLNEPRGVEDGGGGGGGGGGGATGTEPHVPEHNSNLYRCSEVPNDPSLEKPDEDILPGGSNL